MVTIFSDLISKFAKFETWAQYLVTIFSNLSQDENYICHLIGGGNSTNRLLLTTEKFLPGLPKALLTYV